MAQTLPGTLDDSYRCQVPRITQLVHVSHIRRVLEPIAEAGEGDAIAAGSATHESPQSPSPEEVLEVPEPYTAGDEDVTVLDELADETFVWADDLVLDSTEPTVDKGESSVSTEPESTSAVESSSGGEEQLRPVKELQTVV